MKCLSEGFTPQPSHFPFGGFHRFRIGFWSSFSVLLKWIPGNSWKWVHIYETIVSDWHTLMNNICDVLERKIIAYYLLVLNKCLFKAALNWKVFIVICLLHEAVCETQATRGHRETWRLSGLGDCPSSPHGGSHPGALQYMGSQAKLLYVPSKIQVSATVSQPHGVREFAWISWSLTLHLSKCTAHGSPSSTLNFKETYQAQSLLLELASPVQHLFLLVSALHREISSTFLTPLECSLHWFLISSGPLWFCFLITIMLLPTACCPFTVALPLIFSLRLLVCVRFLCSLHHASLFWVPVVVGFFFSLPPS